MQLELNYHSKTINNNVNISIYYPNPEQKSVHVVWLFPGLGAKKSDLILNRLVIDQMNKHQNALFVCVDGYRSFYQNMQFGYNYYDLISQEIPEKLQQTLGISVESERIIGISMGAYGALYHALIQNNRFAEIVSIAGSINIVKRDQIKRQKPGFICDEWQNIFGSSLTKDHDLFAHPKENYPMKIKMYCGSEDHLYDDNNLYFEHLKSIGVNVEYHQSIGAHNYEFFINKLIDAIKNLEE